MGFYDSFFYGDHNEIELQLKCGDRTQNEFYIGDMVYIYGYEDGVYLDDTGKRGVVVIYEGEYVAGFGDESLFDKYNTPLDYHRVVNCKKV